MIAGGVFLASLLVAGEGAAVVSAPTCDVNVGFEQQASVKAYAAALGAGLHDEARRARVWRYAWTGINAGLTVSSFAPLPFVERDKWPELITGGVGSLISTVLTVAWPLYVEDAAVMPVPGSCVELAAMQKAALEYADDEASRVTWPWHLLNVAVGGVYYAIIGVGFGRTRNGVLAGVTALAIGEAQTLSQPTRWARTWPHLRWALAPGPGSASVVASFTW